MKAIIPNLAVKSIEETVKYYQDNFGFELQMAVDSLHDGFDEKIEEGKEYIWAMVVNGESSFMFQKDSSIKEDIGIFYENIGASLTFYIEIEDVEQLYNKIKSKVEIIKHISITWYGQKEFYVKDCNGYILGFASKDS